MIVFVLVLPAWSVPGQASKQVVYRLGAVGDIGMDGFPHNNPRRIQYDDVSNLLVSMDLDGFLLLGDGQHNDGTLQEYQTYYDPYFGRLMNITYPATGNHDYYKSANASGFFTYFHNRLVQITTDPLGLQYGYYSFNLGTWHIVALNSRLGYGLPWSPDNPGPAEWQLAWLQKDLADAAKKYTGTIVYLHHPYYDWETYWTAEWFPDEFTWELPIWQVMYQYHVDLVLGGHNHNYQRWLPQDPYGNYDPNGVRQIVCGTGGAYLWAFHHPPQPKNLVTAIDSSFGALRLTLYDGSYDTEFVSITGKVLDSERGVRCQ